MNTVVHLFAIAGCSGVNLNLGDFCRPGSRGPLVVDLHLCEELFLEELFSIGDSRAVLSKDENYLIRNGDLIELNVPARTINIKISDAELAARTPSQATLDALAKPTRGWERMYIDHVQQAHLGVDLDFLRGSTGSATPRESH
jgi:dihydroxyacid dehydratase/phosphogluconate dehydratase